MPGWVKLEKRKVTQYKNGAVYKTKVIGNEWFSINAQPETYKVDENDYMWVSTLDYHFGPTKPTG